MPVLGQHASICIELIKYSSDSLLYGSFCEKGLDTESQRGSDFLCYDIAHQNMTPHSSPSDRFICLCRDYKKGYRGEEGNGGRSGKKRVTLIKGKLITLTQLRHPA